MEQQVTEKPSSKMISFHVPPFFERVVCFYGSQEELEANTEDMFDDTQEWLNTVRVSDSVGGFCCSMADAQGYFQLIWINSALEEQLHSAIWHESLHATINILTGAGCNINRHEQETATYTQGYIAQNIIDNLADPEPEEDEIKQESESEQKKAKKTRKKRSKTHSDALEEAETIKHARLSEKAFIAHYTELEVK